MWPDTMDTLKLLTKLSLEVKALSKTHKGLTEDFLRDFKATGHKERAMKGSNLLIRPVQITTFCPGLFIFYFLFFVSVL